MSKINNAINSNSVDCTGYKAFNHDLTCKNYKYEVGKTHTFNGNVKMCESGFHFCRKMEDILHYYNVLAFSEYRLFKVKDSGTIIHEDNKSVTDTLTILEEITELQTPELCMAAVTQTGWALKYVNTQTPELCMAAVTYKLGQILESDPDCKVLVVTDTVQSPWLDSKLERVHKIDRYITYNMYKQTFEFAKYKMEKKNGTEWVPGRR